MIYSILKTDLLIFKQGFEAITEGERNYELTSHTRRRIPENKTYEKLKIIIFISIKNLKIEFFFHKNFVKIFNRGSITSLKI